MTSYGPRSLLEINPGLTILKNQINVLSNKFANCEIVLVNGFQADKVMNSTPSNVINVENERFDSTNELRSLALGLRAITTERVIIIYGDLVFNSEAINTEFDKKNKILIDTSSTGKQKIGCNISQNKVQHMMYDLPNKWGQIIYISREELRRLKDMSFNRKNESKFIFEALNAILDKGGVFEPYYCNHKMIDVDTYKDLVVAQECIV